MIIKNCKLVYLDRIEEGSVLIENGKIKEINPTCPSNDNVIDAKGLYLSPGFIDVHIHGAGGHDTMNGTYESLNIIASTIESSRIQMTSTLNLIFTINISSDLILNDNEHKFS